MRSLFLRASKASMKFRALVIVNGNSSKRQIGSNYPGSPEILSKQPHSCARLGGESVATLPEQDVMIQGAEAPGQPNDIAVRRKRGVFDCSPRHRSTARHRSCMPAFVSNTASVSEDSRRNSERRTMPEGSVGVHGRS